VLQSTCTHRYQVDSQLLVVGSQIASLTSNPSFNHNLCCRCPNGSCEAILDIYTLRPFQQYKEHLNARCFDPCDRVLSFWESRKIPKSHFRESWRTPKSHFRECEWRPHTSLKVGLRQKMCGKEVFKLLKVSTLKFEVCAREVFQVVESFKFEVCQREFFANVTSFKSNFKFV
jgi:hypothetical protein